MPPAGTSKGKGKQREAEVVSPERELGDDEHHIASPTGAASPSTATLLAELTARGPATWTPTEADYVAKATAVLKPVKLPFTPFGFTRRTAPAKLPTRWKVGDVATVIVGSDQYIVRFMNPEGLMKTDAGAGEPLNEPVPPFNFALLLGDNPNPRARFVTGPGAGESFCLFARILVHF